MKVLDVFTCLYDNENVKIVSEYSGKRLFQGNAEDIPLKYKDLYVNYITIDNTTLNIIVDD